MRNRKDPEIDTEPTIELPCIVVAGDGVRVCHHVVIEPNDTIKVAIGKEAILQRNIKNFSLWLQCTELLT